VRDALQQDGVHAGIGGDDLEARARRRIALEHAGDVLAQQREQAGRVGSLSRKRERVGERGFFV
jgi:hypothetical protein